MTTTRDLRDAGRRQFLRAPQGGDRTMAQAAEILQQHHKALGDLTGVLRMLIPQVIGVSTVMLDAAGTAQLQYRIPYRALFVDSQSAQKLTVASSPLESAAPGPGAGVAVIRAGGAVVVNFTANVLSLYGGTQGDLVTITAFANPQPPFAR